MATPIEEAAIRYARARQALVKAKQDFIAYHKEHGACAAEGADLGHRERGKCYHETREQDEWCTVCQGSEPFYQAKRRAAGEQGAALRHLMHLATQEDVQIEKEPAGC